ncbi:tetratricopeptide repeat protein [Paludibacter jiangxiensis]|uniref:Tetratricopeptide repeat-containing protein n=1 Tax=Paludibacter jiangxiensis TaxID=681398 RepID=A0A170YJY9_9BACT|nr:tetratricopeptide repeat protein [Paludibacter jiangxiensis]GAT61862.1 tetratricopeptide repeat-containing protein [Paludibacter jiangxiensis]
MKKGLYLLSAAILAFVFTSCSKPMGALDPSYFNTTPNPLEAVGGKVNATVTGKFPEKYFDKKTVVEVTPVLKTASGQEFKSTPALFQGEKIQGNNQSVAYKAGGTFSINAAFDYVPEMAKSELFLEFKATRGNKTYTIPSVKVADGVIATSTLAAVDGDNLDAPIVNDKFQRIIKEKHDANIMFLIQQANIRKGELKKEELVSLVQKIQAAKENESMKVAGFDLNSYASPDGGVKLNTKLSEQREKNTNTYIKKELKKLKTSLDVNANFTAQDWEGFQQLLSSSNIQDKEVILRVLSMYSDPEQREHEIRNLSAAFKNIAQDILPQLRRSKLQLTLDLIGKSDEQIAKLAQENSKSLNVEELLYAATLTNNASTKAGIYEKVVDQFPGDIRGYNNLGTIKFNQGNYAEASRLFAKALAIDSKSPEANYNAGIAALAQGDVAKSQQYFGNAGNIGGNTLNQALGIIYLQQGDFAKAKSAFGNAATNNAALSQILTKDYSAARSTLNSVKNPNGETAYLQAIVGARTNDRQLVYDGMRKAVASNKKWATKATTDAEFAKYLTDSDFQNIIK